MKRNAALMASAVALALILVLLLVATPADGAGAGSRSHRSPRHAAAAAGAGATSTRPLKKHRVSKSSFHTSQGRERDSTREYAGQGTSHLRHVPAPGEKVTAVPLEQGVHAWQPAVRAELEHIVSSELGEQYLSLLPSVSDVESGVPEQIKISVTARGGELVLNWLTWTNSSTNAQIGTASGQYGAVLSGQTTPFVDPNSLHLVRYLHNVLITNVQPKTQYFYRVGDATSGVWSDEQSTRTVPDGSNPADLVPVAMYGDLGLVNSQSMAVLSDDVAKGGVSVVIQVGDFSYNMDELQGMNGDFFLRDLQNVTAKVPFMGCAGNHEQAFNFSHLANKFSNWNYVSDPLGRPDQNWWYSFDLASGGVLTHYISLDTELYYWDYLRGESTAPGQEELKGNYPAMIAAQWHWLVDDLTRAYDSGKYAWIVAYGHRPLYCSNVDSLTDCMSDTELLRKGPGGMYGFEAAFSVRPLDIYFAAHEHSYERTYPVSNGGTVDWKSVATNNLYVSPAAPVHIVAGSAGCREYFDTFDEVFYGAFSAFRSETYGYGRMTVHNATHLHWEQLIDEGNAPSDHLWVQKKPRQHLVAEQPEQKPKKPAQPRIALE